ncbi:MAG: radical SAM protein, partial [Cyclobacteriaceae bacterium]
MKSVLLTHSYFYKLDAKQWRFKQPYPPLGTLMAASVLREIGCEVDFQDACLKEGPGSIIERTKSTQPSYVIIYDDGFNYLTKMCLSVMREAAFSMIHAAKKVGSKIIVCSSDSSDHFEAYLNEGADYIVRGEGEATIKDLIQTLEKKSELTQVAGVTYHSAGAIKSNPPRPVLKDLDSLPLPAWNLVDISAYRNIWLKHHGYFSLNIATTRGCPFKCNWCAKPIYGNRYNSRSPEHVIAEIEMLLQTYQPDHFWMCDDIFGLKPGWVQQFENLITQKKLSFKYKIQSRVDLLLEAKTIEALASSGAETIWVGAESGSQKILDAMDKGTTVEQIRESTKLLKQHGIKVGFFLQFGYSGEQQEDIDKTLKMVLDLMPDEIGISVSYPLPGTKFYESVKADLEEKQNWKDSDDLDMMFAGVYSSSYYKVLHRYVHSRYRVQRGVDRIKNLLQN